MQLDTFQVFEQCRAGVPGRVLRLVHDVVAELRRDRDRGDFRCADIRGQFVEVCYQFCESLGREVDEVDLVDRGDDVRYTDQRRDTRMPTCLAQQAFSGVDEQHRDMGVRRSGERVAGVALVPGSIGEHVAARGAGEEPIGDVDGDPLLALGTQTVGERGQIDVAVVGRHSLEVICRQRAGVVQDTADERRLTVVDAAGGRETQNLSSWCGNACPQEGFALLRILGRIAGHGLGHQK